MMDRPMMPSALMRTRLRARAAPPAGAGSAIAVAEAPPVSQGVRTVLIGGS